MIAVGRLHVGERVVRQIQFIFAHDLRKVYFRRAVEGKIALFVHRAPHVAEEQQGDVADSVILVHDEHDLVVILVPERRPVAVNKVVLLLDQIFAVGHFRNGGDIRAYRFHADHAADLARSEHSLETCLEHLHDGVYRGKILAFVDGDVRKHVFIHFEPVIVLYGIIQFGIQLFEIVEKAHAVVVLAEQVVRLEHARQLFESLLHEDVVEFGELLHRFVFVDVLKRGQIDRTFRNGERIRGQRIRLHAGHVDVKAVGKREHERHADDADAARNARQRRAGLFAEQVPERKRKRRLIAHSRLFRAFLHEVFVLGIGIGVVHLFAVEKAYDAGGILFCKFGVVRYHDDEAVLGDFF